MKVSDVLFMTHHLLYNPAGGVFMKDYDTLLAESDDRNLITKEKSLKAHDGRIKGKRIAIRKDMTTVRKGCVLAEELGHYYTSSGNILDQSLGNNQKQEYRARSWAFKEMITLDDFYSAFKAGCRNRYEIAEHLNVTEDFLEDALKYFRTIYPDGYKTEYYIIQFIPNLDILIFFN